MRGRRRVLVADDDAEVRAVIVEYLEQSGYVVTQADNGIATLRQLNGAPPDVLLLDLMMPRLGGLGALRLITPSQPGVRVIVITANEEPDGHARRRARRRVRTTANRDRGRRARDPRRPARDPRDQRLRHAQRGVGHRSLLAMMQETPDAVLLDIAMPGLSGLAIIPALRFVKQSVKIIMVSGVSDLGLAKQALAYGAFDYVTKPVDFMRLLEAVRAAVDASRAT